MIDPARSARRAVFSVTAAAVLGGAVALGLAQGQMDKVEIRAEKLSGNV